MRVVERDGRLEPLLGCWYAPRALPDLTRRLRDGALSLFAAIRALDPDVVTTEETRMLDPSLRSLVNVNTPEDLASARGTLENY